VLHPSPTNLLSDFWSLPTCLDQVETSDLDEETLAKLRQLQMRLGKPAEAT